MLLGKVCGTVVASAKDERLLDFKFLIVENLTGLSRLMGHRVIFVAAPVKVAGAAAFTVRAFAMLEV